MPMRVPIAPDMPLSLAPSVVSTAIPGETVILDASGDRYFSLQGVGPRVWELLQAPTTPARLVEAIMDEYDVDAETCERDVFTLLAELVQRDLVRAGPNAVER